MATEDQKREAAEKLVELHDDYKRGRTISSVVSKLMDTVVPGSGRVIEISDMLGPPGKLRDYESKLRDVIDGKRDIVPDRPELSPKDFGR